MINRRGQGQPRFARGVVPSMTTILAHLRVSLAAVLALLGVAASVVAQTATTPDEGRVLRAPGAPVRVDLGIFVQQIADLDQVKQTFRIQGYMTLGWNDEGLRFEPEDRGVEMLEFSGAAATAQLGKKIWWPDVEFVAAWSSEFGRHWLTVAPSGRVELSMEFRATVTSFLELRQFPYDSQTLQIVVESSAYDNEECVFVPDRERTGVQQEHALLEWDVADELHATAATRRFEQVGAFYGDYSRVTFEVTAIREVGFYLWKLFLPLLLIVASAWVAFWLRDISVQLGISFTMMLTLVAFNFSVADSLPKASYLTFLDAVFVSSYVSVFLSIISTVFIESSGQHESHQLGSRIKRHCRWLFPAGWLVAIAVLSYGFIWST